MCLLEQVFIKDNNINITEHTNQVAKELGVSLSIESFVRFERGQGIEKKEDNFADEVASMIK